MPGHMALERRHALQACIGSTSQVRAAQRRFRRHAGLDWQRKPVLQQARAECSVEPHPGIDQFDAALAEDRLSRVERPPDGQLVQRADERRVER